MAEATKMKRLWDNYRVIGEVRKSDRIKLVVGAGVRDGVRYLNIHEFYLRIRDQVWRPARDGITVPLSVPVDNAAQLITPYEDLVKLMAEASAILETMEIFDEAHAVYIPTK